MAEGGVGIEKGIHVAAKGSNELLGQLVETHNAPEAKKVVREVGYEDPLVKQRLEILAENDPKEYRFFVDNLRKKIKVSENDVSALIGGFLKDKPQDAAVEVRKQELSKKVIGRGESDPILEQEIKEMFPSGNFLVHGTSVEGVLGVVNDPDLALKSTSEIRKINEKFKGKSGYFGLSFSYNGVGALPGTWRHQVMFVTSPEQAMDQTKKLVVPYYAADKELQLVSKSYDEQAVNYAESNSDLLGISNIMGSDGVIQDFAELEAPYNTEKGNTPIEQALVKIKKGELSPDDIANCYQVIDGKFRIKPQALEGSITEGIIWADYLLKYSEEGRALGKTIADVSSEELLILEKSTPEYVRQLIRDIERVENVLEQSSAVSLPIENTIMYVPEGDLERWLDVFARIDKSPKAFITFSLTEGPKVPNWKVPEGDWQKAEQIVTASLARLGVPAPSIKFRDVVGRDVAEDEIIGFSIKHLKYDVISRARKMVLTSNGLELM